MKQISLITEIRPVFRKSQYELVISLIEALISRDIRLIYSGVECDLFSEIHLICKKNRRQLSGVFPSELKGLIALYDGVDVITCETIADQEAVFLKSDVIIFINMNGLYSFKFLLETVERKRLGLVTNQIAVLATQTENSQFKEMILSIEKIRALEINDLICFSSNPWELSNFVMKRYS